MESIAIYADLLFQDTVKKKPLVDKKNFMKLAQIASCEFVMSTHDISTIKVKV